MVSAESAGAPTENTASEGGPRRAAGMAAACAAMLILFLREPQALGTPQLWAEDGAVFLLGALRHGWGALFETYAGYYHFVPRAVAAFWAGVVSLEQIPLAFNATAVGLTGLVAYLIATARVPVSYAFAFALVPVLVPHSGEVFSTITNIQWFGGALLATLLVQTPARSRSDAARDIAILVAFGLSGPFLLVLTPLLVIRWFYLRPGRFETTELVVALLISAFVAICIVREGPSGGSMHFDRFLSASGASVHHGLGGLFASRLGEYSGDWLYWITAAAAFIFFGLSLYRHRTTHTAVAFGGLALFGGGLLVLACLKINEGDVWHLSANGNGSRYIFIPHILLVWTLLYFVLREAHFGLRIFGISLLLLAGANSAEMFNTPPRPDFKWKEQLKHVAQVPVPVKILPRWEISLCRRPCRP